MTQKEQMAAIEAMLFVAGDPVAIQELQRVLQIDMQQLKNLLTSMEEQYQSEQRGICLLVTEKTAQLLSNAAYAALVQELLQPVTVKSFSQALLETLAIVAYKQPVTRAEIEAMRGIRCEYMVNQLQKLNLIAPVGHKDTIGKPTQFGTTDHFLRKFGIHALSELPNYESFLQNESLND